MVRWFAELANKQVKTEYKVVEVPVDELSEGYEIEQVDGSIVEGDEEESKCGCRKKCARWMGDEWDEMVEERKENRRDGRNSTGDGQKEGRDNRREGRNSTGEGKKEGKDNKEEKMGEKKEEKSEDSENFGESKEDG